MTGCRRCAPRRIESAGSGGRPKAVALVGGSPIWTQIKCWGGLAGALRRHTVRVGGSQGALKL